MSSKKDYLKLIRTGEELSRKNQLFLIMQLSLPAIMAQISTIVMEYIDAAMVGRLGEKCSASIGLVSTSTWLLSGISHALSAGFTVQVAHMIGAGKEKDARRIVRTGLCIGLLAGVLLMLISSWISFDLPRLLGGEQDIWRDASWYFLVYALNMPIYQLNNMSSGMIQCSGNMKFPSILHILMCVLDVVFNFFLIFPARNILIFGLSISVPGMGLGVLGAAIGTALAVAFTGLIMLYYLSFKSESLHLRKDEKLDVRIDDLRNAVKISIPVGIEQVIMSSAYIISTIIVAPLGSVAIAAHSFAITAESLCYMPGYGIGSAATTIVGQSIGAGRKQLAKKLGWLSVGLGTIFMAASGTLMYIIAPIVMGLLTPVAAIRTLGVSVLRIELFAEPLYGASIVATGVFRGAGDTKIPCILNFLSMWIVRLPLSWYLSLSYGLQGVWFAMCIELCVRGIIYLLKLLKTKELGIKLVG